MGTNDNDAGEPALGAHTREESEFAEAHNEAAEIPEVWLAAAADETSLDVLLAAEPEGEAEVLRELFAPLSPAAQARIVDSAVAAYLKPEPRVAEATPIATARPRASRWWLVSLPLTAAAAAAVTLLVVDARAPGGESLPGAVQLASAARATPDPAPGLALHMPPGESAFLECRADGRRITVVGARAVSTAPSDGDASPFWLGWTAHGTEPNGATLHVRADLPRGTWEVSCQVHDTATGRLMILVPPAELVVQ